MIRITMGSHLRKSLTQWLGTGLAVCGLLVVGCSQQESTATSTQQQTVTQQPPSQVTSTQATQETAEAKSTNGTQTELRSPRPYPLAEGTVASVDTTNKIVTVKYKNGNQYQIHVTSQTKITRGGQPISLDQIRPGEVIAGRVQKDSKGTIVALSLRIGPKSAGTSSQNGAGQTNSSSGKEN